MYKILIADDVVNNIRSIKLSLSDLEDEYQLEFLEAENGKVAIDLAKEHKPDIIFMDVMMPEMDGIEASKILKTDDATKDILIIAVTALDDPNTKSAMINSGVKDFITKPFDDRELLIKTRNFIELLETKKSSATHKTKESHISLYDDDSIKSFRIVFKIKNESSLVDFWEFFDRFGQFDKSLISDPVNIIVTVTKVLLKVKKISAFDIIVEEADEGIYITIWNDTFVKAANKYFDKFSYNLKYKEEADKISFKVETSVVQEEESAKEKVAPQPTSTPAPAVTTAAPVVSEEPKEKVIYDFIDEDDMVDIQDTIGDLKSKLLLFGSGELEKEDIDDIAQNILTISSKLKLYPQTFTISNAMEALADSMEDNEEEYITNSGSVAKLFVGFGNDIELWYDSLFVTGTEDLHFLDDTIVTNTETIKQFATSSGASDGGEEDLDDIFDF